MLGEVFLPLLIPFNNTHRQLSTSISVLFQRGRRRESACVAIFHVRNQRFVLLGGADVRKDDPTEPLPFRASQQGQYQSRDIPTHSIDEFPL